MSLKLECLSVGVAVLILMTATLNHFGMAWDEGYTVECEERIGEWFSRVSGGGAAVARAWSPATSLLEPRASYLRRAGATAASPWSRESLRFLWPFAREEPIGHPPFFAILGLAGWAVSHHFLPPPASYRFGAAALFAVTIGVMYGVMARHHGRLAGAMAAFGLLAMPRVFAHAHLASFDAPILCLWFLGVAAFLHAVEPPPASRARTLGFGLVWGCAAATKFTGCFLPIPLAVWTLLYRDRRGARTLGLGGIVALAVVYGLIPTWWADPVEGVRVFLRSNLTRREHSPIPTQFFGRLYPFSLPWYNTLAWTSIVVPPATLILALAGLGHLAFGRLRDRFGVMMLLCWSFFMVLRALPAAPGHDGERQFLPAFAFLACLAGLGVAAIPPLVARLAPARLATPGALAALAVAVGAGALSTWRFHPLQLSYYNFLIGGLSGAYRMGMEPTFYWDALTPDVRAWINTHTEPGRSVMFAYPVAPFEYLHRWRLLTPPPIPDQAHPPRWYVVQNRPGIVRSYPNLKIAAYLLEHGRPVYVKTSSTAPEVPLIAIYAIEDAAEAQKKITRGVILSPRPRMRRHARGGLLAGIGFRIGRAAGRACRDSPTPRLWVATPWNDDVRPSRRRPAGRGISADPRAFQGEAEDVGEVFPGASRQPR